MIVYERIIGMDSQEFKTVAKEDLTRIVGTVEKLAKLLINPAKKDQDRYPTFIWAFRHLRSQISRCWLPCPLQWCLR